MFIVICSLLMSLQSVAGAEFIYCAVAGPTSFNPQIASDGATFTVTRALYNGLLRFEYGGVKVVPALAKAWKVSPDGKSLTFYLRDDVKFHSRGEFIPTRNFNADDVVFSFERMRNQKHPFHSLNGGRYKYFESMEMAKVISKVERLDEYVVRIQLSRPESSIIANLAMDFANILSKEYGDYLNKKNSKKLLDIEPVGTGPFMLTNYEKGKSVQFLSHKSYFDGVAKIKKLKFLIEPNASKRMDLLRKGKCHLAGNIEPRLIKRLREEPNLRVMGQPGLNIFYLAMNTSQKPFDDLRVRKAMNHAIHREKIVKRVFGNHAQVAKNPIPPTMWGYNRRIRDYDYNPQRARELLKEAGLESGLKLELWYMSTSRPYNPNGKLVADMIAKDLEKIGITTKLVTKEWKEYLKSAAAGKPQFLQAGWTSDNGDPDNFLNLLLACASVGGGSNYARWCNPKYSHLVGRARVTTDIRRRTNFYKKAQEIFKKEAPWVPLAHVTMYKVLSKRVKNYKISPFGHDHFHEVSLGPVRR